MLVCADSTECLEICDLKSLPLWIFKKDHIPNDHLLVSFAVKSFFKNVPLDVTIEFILSRIYNKNQ